MREKIDSDFSRSFIFERKSSTGTRIFYMESVI
jgi:hypothetical protein